MSMVKPRKALFTVFSDADEAAVPPPKTTKKSLNNKAVEAATGPTSHSKMAAPSSPRQDAENVVNASTPGFGKFKPLRGTKDAPGAGLGGGNGARMLVDKPRRTGLAVAGKRTLGELFFDGKEPFAFASPEKPSAAPPRREKRQAGARKAQTLRASGSRRPGTTSAGAPRAAPADENAAGSGLGGGAEASRAVGRRAGRTEGGVILVARSVASLSLPVACGNSLGLKLSPVDENAVAQELFDHVQSPLPPTADCPGAPQLGGDVEWLPDFHAGDEDEPAPTAAKGRQTDKDLCNSPLADVTEAYTGDQGWQALPVRIADAENPGLGVDADVFSVPLSSPPGFQLARAACSPAKRRRTGTLSRSASYASRAELCPRDKGEEAALAKDMAAMSLSLGRKASAQSLKGTGAARGRRRESVGGAAAAAAALGCSESAGGGIRI